jgi:hypothetical protein
VELNEVRVQWRARVNTVMNLQVKVKKCKVVPVLN